jgi:hypothetical protein
VEKQSRLDQGAISLNAAAKMLGHTQNTVRMLVRNGWLGGFRQSKRVFKVYKGDVEEMIIERTIDMLEGKPRPTPWRRSMFGFQPWMRQY